MKVPLLLWVTKLSFPCTSLPKTRPVRTLRSAIQRSQGRGLQAPVHLDLYHWLLALSWRHFLLLVTSFYFGLNLLFATILWCLGSGIANT